MLGRDRQGSGGVILRVIMLGILLGFAYVIYDRNNNAPGGEVIASLPATIEPLASPTVLTLPTLIDATPTPVALQIGNVRLFIPKADVLSDIVPVFLGDNGSWNIQFLGDNVGHLQGTGWIDVPGNIVLAGHVERSNGTPGIFAALRNLAYGDDVILVIEGVQRTYSVNGMHETDPQDLSVLYPTSVDQLTLITCDAYDFVTNTYLERMVVTAVRVS